MREEKVLYLDLGMGAAGDMLSAALYDLLAEEEKKDFLRTMGDIGLPDVTVSAATVLKSGIAGTQYRVLINGEEEESEDVHEHCHDHEHGHSHDHEHEHCHEHHHDHDHEHEHEHEHEHGHSHDHEHEHCHEHHHDHDHEHEHEHSHDHGHPHDHEHSSGHHHHHEHHSMEEIRDTIVHLRLAPELKEQVLSVYRKVALAESRVHGKPVSEVHLHEVGMKDAIADIASVCLLLSIIAPDRIEASPVTTGFGHVHCAHGILPVPAPATAVLLQGLPVRSGDVEGELCTPTGAALISQFVERFGRRPDMRILKTGYGMGKKDFTSLNCIRAELGIVESTDASDSLPLKDSILELSCNIDDMSGEEIGFAVGELLHIGAADVWTQAVQMKKNRPGVILKVLCREEDREKMVSAIFRLTTTIGVRESLQRRYVLLRRTQEIDTPYGKVRRKVSEGYGVCRIKDEYDDLAAIARKENRPLREIRGELS